MAVWDDLVVSGTHDFTPVNTHWRVRLANNRGIRAASLAHRAPDLRGGTGAYVSPAGAPLHPWVAIGAPNSRPAPSWDSRAGPAAPAPLAVRFGVAGRWRERRRGERGGGVDCWEGGGRTGYS